MRSIVTLSAIVALWAAGGGESSAQAPANDDFVNRIDLGAVVSASEAGSSVGATKEAGEDDHAGGFGEASVWWSWTAPADGVVVMDTFGSDFDTLLAVYTGNAVNTLTIVVDNDQAGGGNQSEVSFSAVAGTVYSIAVDGFVGEQGTISLQILHRPANDSFADRVDLGSAVGTLFGNNVGASKEVDEPEHPQNVGGASVWWRWTAPVDGQVVVNTFGSGFDTLLAVYTGSALGGLTVVASNDDAGSGTQSEVIFDAMAGVEFSIAVDGYNNGSGSEQSSITLQIEQASGPANDDFVNLMDLGNTFGSVMGSNVGATGEVDEPDHAGEAAGASVWWSWTAPEDGAVVVNTFGSGFDTLLAVYTGVAVDALTPVASNDEGNSGTSPQSEVWFQATAGVVYTIAVDGYDSGSGNEQGGITLQIQQAQVNDAFGDRTVLAGASVSVGASNVGATVETDEPDHAGEQGGGSVWWSWTAPANGTVVMDTFGSAFDTLLAVYTGDTMSALNEEGSNNDDAGGGGPQSEVSFEATAGTAYRIVVDGFEGAEGSIQLRIQQAPANDSFAGRVDLGSGIGSFSGANQGATAEGGEPDHAGQPAAASVWWSWTAPAAGTVVVDTNGSNFDTRLAVYTGAAVDALGSVASDDDGGSGQQSQVSFTAVAGVAYRIAVDGKSGATGSISLQIQSLLNDAFAERVVLGGGASVAAAGSNVGATAEGSEPAHAGQAATRSVWWQWTAPSDGQVVVDTVGSNFDTLLAVYTGNAVGTLVEVAGDDNGGGGQQSRVTFSTVAGTDYSIAVDGAGGAQGSVSLQIELGPANDDFVSRVDLGAGPSGAALGNNVGASAEAGEPAHAGQAAIRSGWWRWTAPADGQVAMDTVGSSFDTLLAVYTGNAVGTLSGVASDNDGGGGLQSRVTFGAVAGTVYSIAVDGVGGAQGSISLQVHFAPGNDGFAERTDLGGGAAVAEVGNNIGAGAEAGEPAHAGQAASSSVWWQWTAPADGRAVVDTVGSNFNTVLAAYTGSALATLTVVASDDDSGGGLQSRVSFQTVAGTEYHFAVDGVGGAQGNVMLQLAHTSAPANDDFVDRANLGTAATATVGGTTLGASSEAGEPVHAGVAGGVSVWWRWTAPTTGVATVDTVGSNFDTLLAVYTGNALGSLTAVAGDDNGGGGLQSSVTFPSVAGTTYSIAVDGAGGAEGNVSLQLEQRLANDDFADRLDLGSSFQTVEATNAGAGAETGEPVHAGVAGRASVWWNWIAPTDGMVVVGTLGSGFDTLLAVYTGDTVETLVEVASNNDSDGGLESKVSFQAVAGTSYRLVVDGVAGAQGAIQLRIQSGVDNDDFVDRRSLGVSLEVADAATNVGAGAEVGEPNHAGDVARASVWWSWTAPANGKATVDSFGSSIDTLLGVYTGESVDQLVEVASNDDADGVAQSRVTFQTAAGTAYHIAIDGFAAEQTAEQGSLMLHLRAIAIGPPANDAFAAGSDLGSGLVGSAVGDLTGATDEAGEPGHAGSAADRSMWWQWTAPQTGDATLRFAESSFVPRVAVYTGAALGSLVPVAGEDGSRAVGFRAEAGTSYRIAVDARSNGDFGAFAFTLVDLANDRFVDRFDLGNGFGTSSWTNLGASAEAGEPDHSALAATRSVWWQWTAPSSGRFTVGTQGSEFDTVLAVYTGNSLSNLVQVAQNDDASPAISQSEVTFEAVGGTTYAIAVDGYGGGQGEIVLVIGGAVPVDPPPANDAFAARADLGNAATLTVNATNLGATAEAGEPNHAGRAAVSSVWWKWTAPANGEVTVDTFGSAFDTVLSVYTGSTLGELVVVASNDDASSPSVAQSRVSFEVNAGTVYQIAVDGSQAHRGSVRLNLSAALVEAPANDAFAARIDLGEVFVSTASGDTDGATPEVGEPPHAGASAARSLWWQWAAPVAGDVLVRTSGGLFTPRVGIYLGTSLATLQPVAVTRSAAGVAFRAVAGATYQIAVDTSSLGGSGPVTVRISDLANDRLADHLDLGSAFGEFAGTNLRATIDPGEPDHVGRTAAASVWWRWTAAASGRVTIRTLTSEFDTVLAIYTGTDFGNMVRVAGNDDASAEVGQSSASFLASGGTSYLIAVDGFGGEQGDIALSIQAGEAAPVNDDFATGTDLGTPLAIAASVSNVGAGGELDEPDRAGQPATASLWWRWTAPAYSEVVVETTGSQIDTVMAVYTGNALGTLVEVASNDDAESGVSTSRVSFRAQEGTVYHFAVDGFSGQQGMVELGLEATVIVTPANDDFAAREDLGGAFGASGGGDLTEATSEPAEPGHAGSPAAQSLWWQWTAPETGDAVVRFAGSGAAPRVGVYTGTTLVGLQSVASASGKSTLRFGIVAGTSYLIAVDARSPGPVTPIAFSITQPTNDLFADRRALGGATGSFSGTNLSASAEAGEPDHAGQTARASVWWSWTALGDATVTISTTGTAFDTLLGVYTGGAINGLTEVASNDDVEEGVRQSAVTFDPIAGTTYQIAVDGYDGEQGEITLTIAVDSAFSSWAVLHGLAAGVNDGYFDDPNLDRRPNIQHFAFDTDPLGGGGTEGKRHESVVNIGGMDYFTLTLPVRLGAVFSGSPLRSNKVDGMVYEILGNTILNDPWSLSVEEVIPALDAGLPELRDDDGEVGADWEYRTFRITAPMSASDRYFMRAGVTVAP